MKKIDVKKLVGIAVSACVIFSAFTSCTEEKWNKNSSINVLSREDGSGTRGAFIELFGVEMLRERKLTTQQMKHQSQIRQP